MLGLKKIQDYKKLFFTVNSKPLTRTSKIMMSIFFIVTVVILIQGITLNIKQARLPSKDYGYKCVEFANIVDKNYRRGLNINLFRKHSFGINDIAFGESKVCKQIKVSYLDILNNSTIQSEISQLGILRNKTNSIVQQQHRINREYSNMLLEKIANQTKDRSILKTRANGAKTKLNELSKKLDGLNQLIKSKSDIKNYPLILKFENELKDISSTILDEYSSARKWYALKRSGQVLGFLLPVWALFFWMFKTLAKREKFVFSHLSFYVANAAALLALVELVHVIYIVMPKVFLGKLIAFLVSLNLGIILNIVGILFFLALFGFIIMRVQNSQEKTDKTREKRVMNVRQSRCWNCGTNKKSDSEFCYNCGEEQKQECKSCKSKILRFTNFCSECGEENSTL